jgi:hypothetical protein
MGVFDRVDLEHPTRMVAAGRPRYTGRIAVRRQLVCGHRSGVNALVLKQFPKVLQYRILVAPILDPAVQ